MSHRTTCEGSWVDPPEYHLTNWRGFIAECRNGYEGSLEDYFRDVSVRHGIEEVIKSAEMSTDASAKRFIRTVHALDQEFQAVAPVRLPCPDPEELAWWDTIAPGTAGEEFVRDLREWFGINIATSSNSSRSAENTVDSGCKDHARDVADERCGAEVADDNPTVEHQAPLPQ